MASDRTRRSGTYIFQTTAAPSARPWQPPADVYRLPDGWLLKFELAGVAPEDVKVAAGGNRVVVRGARLDRCVEAGCVIHQMEIAYSTFERWVELPDRLDAADVRYEFRNGMLLVRVTTGARHE
jgi:HSP20 family molecular chaperone IbpA